MVSRRGARWDFSTDSCYLRRLSAGPQLLLPFFFFFNLLSYLLGAAPPGSDGTRRTQRSLKRTARRPQRSAGRRSPLRWGAPFGGFRRKERRGCPLPLPAFLLLLLLLAPSSRPPRSASGARSHRGAQTAPAAAALAHNGAETHQQGT